MRFDSLKDLDPGKTAEVGIIRGIDTRRNRAINQESLKRNDRAAGRVAARSALLTGASLRGKSLPLANLPAWFGRPESWVRTFFAIPLSLRRGSAVDGR
jgi:hypothetical protein